MNLLEPVRLAAKAMTGLFFPTNSPIIQQLMTGIYPGASGNPPGRGEHHALEAYSSIPWLRAISSRIGDSVASVQWQLFYVKGKNDKRARMAKAIQRAEPSVRKVLLTEHRENDELNEITDHPLLDVLDNGNGYFSGRKARKLTQVFLELTGEAFMIKERNGMGAPIALWPIPPSWVINTPTYTYPKYRISWRGFQTEIPDTEILWIMEPNPANPFARGTGMAQALADELETDEYTSKFIKAFFFNGARPDLIISPKGEQVNMAESEVTRFEKSWMDRHQGFWRAFRPFFSRREISVTPLEQNFQHLQLKELREQDRDIIIQTWGLPPEIFGILENSNRATIDSADYFYNSKVIVPRLEDMRAFYQQRLVPEYDDRLILDYVSPVQEDRSFSLDAMKAAPWAYSADEWRAAAGKEPIDGDKGQIYAVPINLTLQEELTEADPVVPPPALPGKPSSAGEPDPNADPNADPNEPAPKSLKHMSDTELLALHRQLTEGEAYVCLP